jgi:pyruvate/2-oxoglutarate dehydrogenase complex dihydrolipoamide dehydrogenase (E3) component
MVVIGGGIAGLTVAKECVKIGAKTALVEKFLIGGDAFIHSTVILKGLQKAGRLARQMRNSSKFGVNIKNVKVDFEAVMTRIR